ncbi:MAG: TonB-dependent siderophore receptor [Verrucomicrobia bacterium]|nr:TonB-dependent siderophore receptor [Verrucomicrobiota bacterium]
MGEAAADSSAALDLPGRVLVEGSYVPEVSSSKFTEPVRNLPQTITIIPRKVIEEQNALNLRDVLRNVPGITFQAGEGGGGLPGDSFTLRGFSATGDISVDGIRDNAAYSRDAFNIEQVEVIKGPASVYAGRGATSGGINLVTKSPTKQASYQASGSVGTDGYYRATADLNQPIAASPIPGTALRLNAVYQQAGYPGRDVVESKRYAVNPVVAFGLGTSAKLTLGYLYMRQDNVPDYGLPWGVYPGYPTGAYQANPPVPQNTFYGLRNYDFEVVEQNVATAQLDLVFSPSLRLSTIARYADTRRSSAITAPRPPNRQLQLRDMENENFDSQTTLNAAFETGPLKHALVGGIDLSHQATFNRNAANTANQPPITVAAANPNDAPRGPIPRLATPYNHTSVLGVAAYAFDTVKLGERWEFSAGLRFDHLDTHFRGADGARLARTDNVFSWRAGVVYKPTGNGSIYASFGTAFKPVVDAGNTGSGLSTTPTAANNVNLSPEKTRNYEVGTKWDVLEGKLSLTAALFRTEKTNAQSRTTTNDAFTLSGKQIVQGVELGVAGHLTKDWSIFGGYAFLDSSIPKSRNPVEEDRALTLTPRHSATLWTTYQLPKGFSVGLGAQYTDSVIRSRNATTGVELSIPGYTLYNAMIAWEPNKHVVFRLNGENLGDKFYVDRVGGGHYVPGPRRQIIFSTTVKF